MGNSFLPTDVPPLPLRALPACLADACQGGAGEPELHGRLVLLPRAPAGRSARAPCADGLSPEAAGRRGGKTRELKPGFDGPASSLLPGCCCGVSGVEQCGLGAAARLRHQRDQDTAVLQGRGAHDSCLELMGSRGKSDWKPRGVGSATVVGWVNEWRQVPDFETWGIDMLVTQVRHEEAATPGRVRRTAIPAAYSFSFCLLLYVPPPSCTSTTPRWWAVPSACSRRPHTTRSTSGK